MATIRKRSNRKGITWQIDCYDPQGKRVMKCFPKKADAEAYLGKVMAAKKEGRYHDVFDVKRETQVTSDELAGRYVENFGTQRAFKTSKRYLLDVVEALDGKDSPHNFEPWKKMVEERSGSFPAGMRWFLLNKLFQMRPAEIACMESVKHPSAVRGMIIRVSDQLRCGEISLFEVDQEETEAAQARLEAERAQRRARYAKNREKINIKRRGMYAFKKSLD